MNFRSFCLPFLGVLCAPSAWAFPPAPPSTVYGSVRGEFGFSLTDGQTEILLLANDQVVQRSKVSDSGTFGENYRLTLPMDLNPAKGVYRAAALTPGASIVYSFVAERNGHRIPVLKVETGEVTPEATTVQRVDFILGEDIDGDALPDAWERFQVGMFDLDTDDPLSILGEGDYDGDGLSDRAEYIAGTFALVFQDGLNFRVVGKLEDGRTELKFLALEDKKYRIECSSDLQTWTPVFFSAEGSDEASGIFQAENTVEQTVFTEPEAESATLIYRLFVD